MAAIPCIIPERTDSMAACGPCGMKIVLAFQWPRSRRVSKYCVVPHGKAVLDAQLPETAQHNIHMEVRRPLHKQPEL